LHPSLNSPQGLSYFFAGWTLEGPLKKMNIEHPTSNIECLMGKADVSFSFDVGRWMFDVGRSFFNTPLYGINFAFEYLQNRLALMP
jgi:hypothetical protein